MLLSFSPPCTATTRLFSFRLRLGKLLFSFLLLLLLLLRLRVIPDLSYVSDLSCLFLIMVKSFFFIPGRLRSHRRCCVRRGGELGPGIVKKLASGCVISCPLAAAGEVSSRNRGPTFLNHPCTTEKALNFCFPGLQKLKSPGSGRSSERERAGADGPCF